MAYWLEVIWQVFGASAFLASMPLIAMSTLTFNEKNWIYSFKELLMKSTSGSRALDATRKGRADKTWKIPSWAFALLYFIVFACSVLHYYFMHENHGAFNGWNTHPIPLILTVTSFAFGNSWWPTYLASSQTCMGGVTIPIIFSAVTGLCAIIKGSDVSVGWALCLLPWVIYQLAMMSWVIYQERYVYGCYRKPKSATSTGASV